ncbi:Hsp20 family protein [Larsenimonas rhizosphaerae]|uniref:Hsp20 family protein n=1 Tax=Larsenimonas rhizosphaerae TaxID=2944682 RepID=A0AA41ZHD4_9GAMM|nr:Hsp20 family protein [Larsenimonas rhizosphaerae]MCM2131356.1 Hsp20 family protein [Larsenimonas rhizosphaerae]MCX2525279.1 Hsp20 family protein [Larsenimonas rhizosphaerae]
MNSFSLSPLFRRSIGFDRLNDLFDYAVQNDAPSYPPYNIEKRGENDYHIVIAAAGFAEKELDVSVEKGVLTISSSRAETEQGDSEPPVYLHRGIAQRAFKLSFRLDENIEVRGARLENGLLHVDLLRVVPEQQRPRQIPINGQAPESLSHQTREAASAPRTEESTPA